MMDFATFWQTNAGAFFEGSLTAWSVRYVGTLDDYESQRSIIADFFMRHAGRRGLRLLTLSAVADTDGGFIVYGVAGPAA